MIQPRENIIIVSIGKFNSVINANSMYLIYNDDSAEQFYIQFEDTWFSVLKQEQETMLRHQWEVLCLESIIQYYVNQF